jgi:hypothetical protein
MRDFLRLKYPQSEEYDARNTTNDVFGSKAGIGRIMKAKGTQSHAEHDFVGDETGTHGFVGGYLQRIGQFVFVEKGYLSKNTEGAKVARVHPGDIFPVDYKIKIQIG